MSAVLILGESLDDYHASDCVSNSKLGVLEEGGPALYAGRYVHKTIPKPETTDALRLGCAFDTLVTEGRQEFAKRYVISPDGMKFNTTEGKEWKRRHVSNEDRLIRWPEYEMMQSMEAALLADPLYAQIITPKAIAQATVRMQKTKYGVGVQSKPDWLIREPCEFSGGRPYSVNLKTTADWSDWFKESDPNHPQTGSPVYTYNYHRQAAIDQWCLFNVEEIGETAHFLLVIEKQEPFRVGWVQLSDEYLEAGWREAHAGLMRLKHHYETGEWPKTTGGMRSLNPPRWLVERSLRAEESVQ